MAVRPIDGEALLKELTCDFTGTPFHGNKKVTIGEVRRIIESMPTLTPQNEWISVEDRLPEFDERVFVTDGFYVGEGYINPSAQWFRSNGFQRLSDITHWMPLPAPPEKEE